MARQINYQHYIGPTFSWLLCRRWRSAQLLLFVCIDSLLSSELAGEQTPQEEAVSANNHTALREFADSGEAQGNVLVAGNATWIAASVLADASEDRAFAGRVYEAIGLRVKDGGSAGTPALMKLLDGPDVKTDYQVKVALFHRDNGEERRWKKFQADWQTNSNVSLTVAPNIRQWPECVDNWVSHETQGRLALDHKPTAPLGHPLLASGCVASFHARWRTPFSKSETTLSDFYCGANDAIKVPMMTSYLKTGYWRGDQMSVVAMPYEARNDSSARFSMLLILPDNPPNSRWIREHLRPEQYQSISERVAVAPDKIARWKDTFPKVEEGPAREKWLGEDPAPLVLLQMPRFGLSQNSCLTLENSAAAPTMPRLVTAKPTEALPTAEMYVNEAAAIRVDEEGTEARAASIAGGIFDTPSGRLQPVRLDRSFIFVLREEVTGMIVMIGRVDKPE